MAFTGFDPRDDLIASFTNDVDYDRDGNTEKCVQPTNDIGDTVNVPVLCVEESRLGDIPYLPLVEVMLVALPSHATNLGTRRFNDAIIDFNIYVQNDEHITVKDFIQSIANTIVNGITTYNRNSTFSNFLHAEIMGDGRLILEEVGSNIVFHKVISVRAIRYDKS